MRADGSAVDRVLAAHWLRARHSRVRSTACTIWRSRVSAADWLPTQLRRVAQPLCAWVVVAVCVLTARCCVLVVRTT